jgi:folate-binding protein YgfZ
MKSLVPQSLRLLSYPLLVPKSYICRSCFSRFSASHISFSQDSRSYSTTSRPVNPPPPPSSGFANLPTRRLISLSGPDAAHFLQGVITSNISPSKPPSSGFYAALLNAQGRVLNDIFIYPDPASSGQGWLIEVDAVETEKLYKHAKRYKLRAKFDVHIIEEGEMSVWSVWQGRVGKDRNERWTPHTIGRGAAAAAGAGEIGCVDSRAPGMGRRLILPAGKKPLAEDSLEEVDEQVYRVQRFLKGVAEGQGEILREAALPQESNLDFMGAIDYRKGCYVGQELTIRTHHTGVVRKRILPVMIYPPHEEMPRTLEYRPEAVIERPPAETSIGRVDKRGRSAGKWLAGIGNIGLGLCRLEAMTDTVVQGEPGGYKEGDEFKLEWDGDDGNRKTVKVKAFVPPWHLTR